MKINHNKIAQALKESAWLVFQNQDQKQQHRAPSSLNQQRNELLDNNKTLNCINCEVEKKEWRKKKDKNSELVNNNKKSGKNVIL